MSKKQYTTIYLVVYDWVDGTAIHDAFTTPEAAQAYIEDLLRKYSTRGLSKNFQIQEIRLWGNEL
jgi:hypothetical protein